MPTTATEQSEAVPNAGRTRTERVRKRPRRVWTDQDKANAIATFRANGGNLVLTSELTGIPKNTIWYWTRPAPAKAVPNGSLTAEHVDRIAPVVAKKEKNLADKFEDLANALVDAAFNKIDRANLAQTIAAAGIAVEKMRLLRGESTSISETRDLGAFTDRDLADLDTLASRIVAQFQPEKVSKPDEPPTVEEPVVVVLEGSTRGDPVAAESGQASQDGVVEPASDQTGAS